MHYLYPTLSLILLASLAAAGDIDANDLPTQCKQVCAPIVSLTASCDAKTHDDDTEELNCICRDSRAASSLPICDACISKYSKDGRDNDANDLVRSCSFTTTSFDPSMTDTATETSPATETGTQTQTQTQETGSGAGGSMTTTTDMGAGMASETGSGTVSSSGGSMGAASSSSSSATSSPSDSVGGISSPGAGVILSLAAGFFASFLI